MSPPLIFLALIGVAMRSWICALPMAAAIPRILWQLGPQWRGILHGAKAAARACSKRKTAAIRRSGIVTD